MQTRRRSVCVEHFSNVMCLHLQVPRAYEAMVEGADYVANDIIFKVRRRHGTSLCALKVFSVLVRFHFFTLRTGGASISESLTSYLSQHITLLWLILFFLNTQVFVGNQQEWEKSVGKRWDYCNCGAFGGGVGVNIILMP